MAGWGKNEFDGSFQFKQKKVALPLVQPSRCNTALKVRARNEPSRSLKFHNHGEGPYEGLLLVERGYYRFHI